MSVGSFFKNIGSWLWNELKSIWGEEGKAYESIKALAIPIVEAVGKFDLNGDGRIAAATEIIAAAEQVGLGWGTELLAKGKDAVMTALSVHYTDSDLKRYLAVARTALAIVEKYTIKALPGAKVLNGIIEVVVNSIESV